MAFSDPFELNYSKVRAYLTCPFLYKYVYLDRKYPPHTPFSSLGISVHRALARYHSGAREKRGIGDLLSAYDDSWHHQGFATPQQTLEFYRDGRRILENYWRAAGAGDGTMFTEKDFDFPFERWRVRGTIDRVDRLPDGKGCAIIDYKMGFEKRTREALAGDLQLSIYAIGLGRNFGLEVRELSWMMLIQGERISVPYDPSGEEKVLAILRETGEKLLALDLSRKGDCASCPI
ncbi:MAG TPA: PD-(D/E)XK nuclease family protein, partial [Elusimicrobiales bacterium]|nr:PD-(D/E)XK nuclease family protein [Elusimicrobiales bacterium]